MICFDRKKISRTIRLSSFYLSVSLVAVSFSALVCVMNGLPQETQISERIAIWNAPARMTLSVRTAPFLDAYDFYVGYEFGYKYSTPYTKTFFVWDKGSLPSVDYECLFFSSNTGMTDQKYLAPRLAGLEVVSGQAFTADWGAGDCYLSESYFQSIYGPNAFDGTQVFNVDGYDLKIVGLVGDKSVKEIEMFLGTNLVLVSREFAYSHFAASRLETVFTKRDLIGNERFLRYYLFRFQGNIAKNGLVLWTSPLSQELLSDVSSPSIVSHAVFFVVSLAGTVLSVIWITLKKETVFVGNQVLFVAFFFVCRLLLNLLEASFFAGFGMIIASPFEVAVSILIFLILLLAFFFLGKPERKKKRSLRYYRLDI